MAKILINTKGEKLNMPQEGSCLEITWHKAFNEIYCHHAHYKTGINQTNIDFESLALIKVKVRVNYIENKHVKSFSDKEIIRHLPFKKMEERVVVPLHSTELLDALCENEWTTLKEGKRGTAKSFPLSMEVTLPVLGSLHHSFEYENEKFPFTLCENYFESINEGDKLETVIYFS